MPDLSVIYVNWNTCDLLLKSIASLKDGITGIDYDIWVVDNASSDDSIVKLQANYPQVNLIKNDTNAGFAQANNQGMKAAQGRYFLLLNTDAFAAPAAITRLYNLAEKQPQAGMVGAQLVNPDGSFQASYVNFPTLGQEFLKLSGLGRQIFGQWYPNHAPRQGEAPKKVDYIQGCCMLVRRQAYQAVGGMDEGYFMYSEEVDWCYSMHRAGWEIWYEPEAVITHIGGASSRTRAVQRETDLYISGVRYFRKNYGALPANLLKVMMVGMASVKYILHSVERIIKGGQSGRRTVSPAALISQMKKIQQ